MSKADLLHGVGLEGGGGGTGGGNTKRVWVSQRWARGSPEDAVGGREVKAAPVHFLHVAHVHVDEGDTDAQLELLMGAEREGGQAESGAYGPGRGPGEEPWKEEGTEQGQRSLA